VSMTTTPAMLWQGEWGEYFGIIAADLTSGAAWDVLAFKGGAANNVGRINLASGAVRARQIDGDTWLFGSGFFASGELYEDPGQLMKITLARRSHSIIENRLNARNTEYDWLIDAHGLEVAISSYDEVAAHWRTDVGLDGHLHAALSGESQIDVPRLQ